MKTKIEMETKIKKTEKAIQDCKDTFRESLGAMTLKLAQLNTTIENGLCAKPLTEEELAAFEDLLEAAVLSKKSVAEITGMLELLRNMKAAYTSSTPL